MTPNWTLVNTISLATLAAGVFRSSATKNAVDALKTELAASKERADRLESERNEYRDKLHLAVQDSNAMHLANVELKARTDFEPVMKFQKEWYKEQSEVSAKLLEAIVRVNEVLARIEKTLVPAEKLKG